MSEKSSGGDKFLYFLAGAGIGAVLRARQTRAGILCRVK